MNKKAAIDLMFNWAEYLALIVLVIGFIIAFSVGSQFMAYTVILLAGFFFGRIWYKRKSLSRVPWIMVIMGFLIGFTIGVRYGRPEIIIVLFALGVMFGYYVHVKKWV